MKIEKVTVSEIKVVENEVFATVHFKTKNVGHSPAHRVTIIPHLLLDQPFGTLPPYPNKMSQMHGPSVFADDNWDYAIKVRTSMSSVIERQKSFLDGLRADKNWPIAEIQKIENDVAQRGLESRIYLNGAICYTFLKSNDIHQTSFIYQFQTAAPEGVMGSDQKPYTGPYPTFSLKPGLLDASNVWLTSFDTTVAT